MPALTSALKRAILIRPEKTATICGDRIRTWREVGDRVAKAAMMFSRLGVGPNDRVAVLCLNSDRYLELYFATLWAGAVIVPVNWRWSMAEISQCFADCDPRLLVVDDVFAGQAEALMASAPQLVGMLYIGDGETPMGAVSYEQEIAQLPPAVDAERRGEDLAGLFYTGGTTGRSKGVMLTHRNVMWGQLDYLAHTQPDQDDVYLHVAPMFHVADMASVFGITTVGGTHVFAASFEPDQVLDCIETNGVTSLTLVPTMLQMLIDRPRAAEIMTRIRRVLYGASPISPTLLKRALDMLPNVQFFQCYGMTELAPMATILSPIDHYPHASTALLTSAGRPVFGVELRIVDSEDRELLAGEVGEVAVRGPNVMQGYWNNPEETEQALRGGWMHTGDAGYLDSDGYLHLVDRLKDMIVVGGENVYSSEIENVLMMHPDVVQCAVIGVPSDKWGEAVHAVIVVRTGAALTKDTVVSHCRNLLAGYKCPATVALQTEPLALSGVGKILKGPLRLPHWDQRSRHIS